MDPPPPPPSLPSVLAHLRSLLSAASSALSSLPTPLLPSTTGTSTTTTTTSSTLPTPPPTTPLPSLPSSPTSATPLPLPATPAPYYDCPAVVRTTNPPPASSSLPAFLAAVCADFSSSSSTTVPTLSSPPRILPSELCLLRREVDSWGNHHLPRAYSYAAVRVVKALRLGVMQWEADLRRWLLASSPRYGVVIDAVTRNHMFVLVRLCLNAMAAEAECSLEHALKGQRGEFLVDPEAARFDCPRLADVVSWLAAQLEVLYGTGNGRFLAIAVIKEAILRLGSCLAVGVGGSSGEEGSELRDTTADRIFVSQVAAAIAALHERLSLEEKIRALQAPRPSEHQLLFEYSQVLQRGHDERSKRPNYRPILEYDGILSRRADNQESGRSKTRDELLAEERDYKRRRMSYRGKKMKRNPTEILRDIIDEHMEDIKQAGGVDCLAEAPGEIAQNMLKTNSHGGAHQGSFYPTSSTCDKAVLGFQLPSCENSPHTDSFGRVSSRGHDTRDSCRNIRYENSRHQYQNASEHEKGGIRESESAMSRGYSDQHENDTHTRNTNDQSKYGHKYKKNVSDYRSESNDHSTWSKRTPKSSEKEYGGMSGNRSNDRTRTNQNQHRSMPVNKDQFSDRYDPQSRYSDEDPPTSMCYDVSDGKHEIYHDEIHPREHHVRKRDHNH
ncbi:unnamed protein product [Alopecurus aequalis]